MASASYAAEPTPAELQAGDLAITPILERIHAHVDSEHARAFRLLSSTTDSFLSPPQAASLLNRALGDHHHGRHRTARRRYRQHRRPSQRTVAGTSIS